MLIKELQRGTSQDQITNLARRNLISVDSVTASKERLKRVCPGQILMVFRLLFAIQLCWIFDRKNRDEIMSPDNIYNDLMATEASIKDYKFSLDRRKVALLLVSLCLVALFRATSLTACADNVVQRFKLI